MTIIESIILGIVQGLGEFLPISSSGHLSALQYFFGIDSEKVLSFAVMLHFGTLVAIFIVYWKDICDLVVEFIDMLKDVFTGKGPQVNKNETRRLGFMIIVATIPTAVIGLLFNDTFEALYSSIIWIGIGLIITGTCLWLAEKLGGGDRGIKEMTFLHAFIIGVCQGIAIWPGISRSGATMVGGLASKFDRAHAVRFAFLISIPSVLGAFVLELPDVIEQGTQGVSLLPVLVGTLFAAVFGYAAIKLMIKLVTDQKLFYFSIYTWAVGLLLIVIGVFSVII